MAKAKTEPKITEELGGAAVMDSEPTPPPPVKKVKNLLRQEWIEEVPSPATIVQPEPETVTVIADSYEPEPIENPIEMLFREIGSGNESYSVTVWELPNYGKDLNSSPTAKRILHGSIPLPPSISSIDELSTLIQEHYGTPGQPLYYFQPTIRCGNRIKRNLPVISIKPIANTKQQTTEPRQENNAVTAAVSERDPFIEFERGLKMVERVQRITGNVSTITPAATELTSEAAMLKLLSEDPERLNTIRKKIFGNPEPVSDSGFNLLEMAKPFLPVLMQGVTVWLQSRNTNQQPVDATTTAPAPPAPPIPATPPAPEELIFLSIWGAANQNAPIDNFMNWLADYENQFPEITPYIDTMTNLPSTEKLIAFVGKMGNVQTQATDQITQWFQLFHKHLKENVESPDNV